MGTPELGKNDDVIKLTQCEIDKQKTNDDLHELCQMFHLDGEKDQSVVEFMNSIKDQTKCNVSDLLSQVDALPEELPLCSAISENLAKRGRDTLLNQFTQQYS